MYVAGVLNPGLAVSASFPVFMSDAETLPQLPSRVGRLLCV